MSDLSAINYSASDSQFDHERSSPGSSRQNFPHRSIDLGWMLGTKKCQGAICRRLGCVQECIGRRMERIDWIKTILGSRRWDVAVSIFSWNEFNHLDANIAHGKLWMGIVSIVGRPRIQMIQMIQKKWTVCLIALKNHQKQERETMNP